MVAFYFIEACANTSFYFMISASRKQYIIAADEVLYCYSLLFQCRLHVSIYNMHNKEHLSICYIIINAK